MRVWEPLSIAIVCAWLAWGSLEEAEEEVDMAITFGALLGGSFVVAAAALTAGLAWGGAWRELPTSVSWPVMQALECLPPLLHTAILSHWTLHIKRMTSASVWAMLFFVANAIQTSYLQKHYVIATTAIMFMHQCALVGYDALTSEDAWTSIAHGDSLMWLDTVLIMLFAIVSFGFWYSVTSPTDEKKRREDFRVHARAELLHGVAHGLVSNFLPAPVLKAVQDRATRAGGEKDSEIVAWAYDPACCLQSDIVGFTSLGSRISPNELCG